MTNQTQTQNTPTNANVTHDGVDLSARFILVKIKTRSWNNNKSDKEASAELESQKGAKVGKALKSSRILLDPDALQPVKTALNAITSAHRDMTTLWDDSGYRLLPTSKYFEYHAAINAGIVAFNQAADELAQRYPALKDEAVDRLGGLYRSDDYPQGHEFRDFFKVVPASQKLDTSANAKNVALPADEVRAIEESMKSQFEENLRRVQHENWSSLFEVISRMKDSLKKYHNYLLNPDSANKENTQKTVHRTLIEQIELACSKAKTFNVTNDIDLDNQIDLVRKELASLDIESLRGNPVQVQAVASKADVVAAKIKAKAKDLAGYLN